MGPISTQLQSCRLVRTLRIYDQLDSTSDTAAELVRQGNCELPLVVWARRQSLGRGRGTHEWWSDSGSLTFTLAIEPTKHGLLVADEPKLALAMAVSIVKALRALELGSSSLGIRWPNDLEIDGRKLGGILPERLETEHGRRVLIGVGLNVLSRLDDSPAAIRTMATSLAEIHGTLWDASILRAILAAILGQFERDLERLVAGDSALTADWGRLDLLRDQPVQVDLGTRIIAGTARGIDADGSLSVDDGSEQLRLFGGQVLRP
jgi:BirA family transcriptional regulator, biotin operon repressor / biotin---[acetyl-CoA-carboxylase] ligase